MVVAVIVVDTNVNAAPAVALTVIGEPVKKLPLKT